ncbi:bifunctional [glutamate--ammonia ligase]-adenylyl-L-tyrosine phosphorylase/[glutamate--ammonia-ligase] adenylyltransferase [Massilia antarctica]|uniref:bifunctional [glutamate--ammonia ligase]-adenylyl-L-tyrosine phosphorylase/[glutamate--ammonia-ligase] adenylyltransferase n=1 Tax=Massilia antarctica TaxID=2765360 RepID=UPI0006BB81AA|nr:bifunctional [glutamate--ammonia ligase]-adenylyl-L-tyrosine phosphorylase/[glutamate--ammonia-ligase] adenylyltransferase [Massilia sp. H27-R4]MCY0913125.1 bifunctional [glutamate--ammonia ligase]-adenylyl-L-tyrosine phosphorylase/[glutamate--ammonia-ligase] adenylyltransferase [Massilia sp. H27-R4]CUI07725.1 Glutamate-ammonia-ligase adenylyltransferase [Janthinobacterium sp. CG23_2]CUU31511.1 Glutamate-ammonia-ligase adenylyltransferase [Janthinobacterium sp. CG23_2]
MNRASLTPLSRFYQRWLAADASRAGAVAALGASALDQLDLAQALAAQRGPDGAALVPGRAMRRLRNLLVAGLIARDLDGRADLAEVVATMTGFADFAIRTHLAALMAEQVASHGMPVGYESGLPQEMIVLAMGKQGGGELNVSSDIDLIFVYPEDGDTAAGQGQRPLSNHEFFARLGKKLIAALSEITEDGFTFRVDMALRPNGNSGPLVASLNMVEEYLIVQGREWERYAWVKARAVSGSAPDIAALEAIVHPFVYRRYLDFGVIDAIRTMHAQIRAEVERQERLHPDRSNNVKLGRGGIREIEFLAQVFQLIRGGRDAALRDRSTRATLRVLADKELLPPETVKQLLDSYSFLRNLEHRLQYLDDAQTHTLPASEADRAVIAQMMRLPDVATLLAQLEQHRQFVAAQFDAIFSDKSEQTGDTVDPGASSWAGADLDNREAIEAHLRALSFDDAGGAAQRLMSTWQSGKVQALPEASRTRLLALVNAALPLIAKTALEAGSGSASSTLTRLLAFFEAIARRSAYLSLLTEYPHTLERVIRMMYASGWAATFLTQHPIVLDELLDERVRSAVPDRAALAAELKEQLGAAAGDTERQMDILREAHHAQLFRLLAQDLAGELTVEKLADYLSALADTIVAATIDAAWQAITTRHREVPRFAVIAYGKLGGKELGYVSDLDVIFLFDDDDQEAPGNYAKLAQRFITWMTAHTSAGILFDIDTALRPDGASGMLVSSVTAFERYQENSAWIWEHQALTRARFCAGDAAIGERFEAVREGVLRLDRTARADELRAEVLKMRKKMHDAYPSRPGQFELKQDEGGMIDVEFMSQYLVLRHAAQYPQLTVNLGNIGLLRMFADLGLIDADLALAVGDAYRAMRKLQHQLRLQGKDSARIDPALVARHSDAVRRLWAAVFG